MNAGGGRLTDAEYALKAATRRAVKLAGGPVEASHSVRSTQGLLSAYGNNEHGCFVPLDVACELDRLAGEPVILRALADLCGFDLTPRGKPEAQLADDVTALAGALARDSGNVISTAIEAAADGELSPNEARRIDDAAADLQDKVVSLRTATRRHVVAQ